MRVKIRSTVDTLMRASCSSRWGEMVNSFSNYSNEWNGLDENGNEVTEGGYMWVLKILLPNGQTRVERGTVTVVRYQ